MNEAKLRRSFPETKPIHYEWIGEQKPTFAQLKESSYGSGREITLKNKATGELERMILKSIVGYGESPVTTFKWIWWLVSTDDDYGTALIFDYLEGRLTDVIASTTPKSLPVEAMKERVERVSYAAAATAFDVFHPSPAE